MPNYNYKEDKKIYKENHSAVLNITRDMLFILLIVQRFVLKENMYNTALILCISYLVQQILNYKKVKYKADLIACICLGILTVCVLVLDVMEYVKP